MICGFCGAPLDRDGARTCTCRSGTSAARWVLLWGRVLRGWRRSIRSKRERRIYAQVVLHSFRAHQRFQRIEAQNVAARAA